MLDHRDLPSDGPIRRLDRKGSRAPTPPNPWQDGYYDVAKVSAFLFGPEAVAPADVAIVFGMTAWQRPLARALDLYRRGLARKLLFTGGYNARAGVVEALAMAAGARDLGVREADILVEPAALNTAENLCLSRRLIEDCPQLQPVRAILMVAIEFHRRRVLLTAEGLWAPAVRIGCATYPSRYYAGLDWHRSGRGRRDVMTELRKIETYLGLDLAFLNP